jgi:hypothetical protein
VNGSDSGTTLGADRLAGEATGIVVEVVTRSGYAEPVSLRLQPDTVEVWFRGSCCGVFDRAEMRSWLAGGRSRLSAEQVTWSLDPRSDGERVAISLDDVIAWTISPAELVLVRARV